MADEQGGATASAANAEGSGAADSEDTDQNQNLTAHEMLLAQFPPMKDLRAAIEDFSAPLPMRMRAVYYLRTIASDEAIDVLGKGLLVRENTPLMRHELAYVLGQIQNARACPVLEKILGDDDSLAKQNQKGWCQ